MCLYTFSFAQYRVKNTFSEEEINTLVLEVFQEHASDLVFSKNSKRLSAITHFLNKQFTITYSPKYVGKKYKSTTSLALNNKYNKNIQADQHYNPETFNPLKYKFPFNSTTNKIYRVANTNYIITILAQH